jgi:hypothetical protein
VRTAPTPLSWLWALGALAGLALALGSYEQAVMLPAALLGTAICLRWQRYRVRWQLHFAFWALLGGYLALRAAVLPTDVSAYQAQQFRSGSGVLLSLMDYVFPAFAGLLTLWNSFELGPGLLLTYQPWQALIGLASNVVAVLRARRDWILPLTGWALSIVTFLPMAWMKHFDHYHYWPMAMRALFVVAMAGIGAQALVSAASRPARRAPPRPDPAPGSLPRP